MMESTAALLGALTRYLDGHMTLEELYAFTALLDASQTIDAEEWEDLVAGVWHVLHGAYDEGLDEVTTVQRLSEIRTGLLGHLKVSAGVRPSVSPTFVNAALAVRVSTRFNTDLSGMTFTPQLNVRLSAVPVA